MNALRFFARYLVIVFYPLAVDLIVSNQLRLTNAS